MFQSVGECGKFREVLGLYTSAAVVLLCGMVGAEKAAAQQLDWASATNYQYIIKRIAYDPATRNVSVIFTVGNPKNLTLYDIFDPAATQFQGTATLRVNVGWSTAGLSAPELINTGSLPGGTTLLPIIRNWMNTTPPSPGGVGASYPNVVNALKAAKKCSTAGSPCPGALVPDRTYFVTTTLPSQAVGTGRAAIEGHPVIQTGVDPTTGAPVFANIPVKGVYKDFAITTTAVRRQVVDFAKCAKCHDGKLHGTQLIPRLSLHGGNRTEEPGLCVMCHNPNQTDGAYRASGQEVSVDFKVMVHSIHAASFRKTKYIVVGFQGAVTDFSTVKFPGVLKNCALCHIDNGTKGTFELPLVSTLGSTTNTGSVLNLTPGQMDVNPVNDLKTSPIAATCSACHDGPYIHNHMVQMGGQFGVVQSVLAGKEQCATCHGPGRQEDVRKAHGVSGGSTGGSTGGTSRD